MERIVRLEFYFFFLFFFFPLFLQIERTQEIVNVFVIRDSIFLFQSIER